MHFAAAWAIDLTPTPAVLTVIFVVGIALMGVGWFAIRFWLASTRPANIQDIQTPALDRLNRRALEAMAGDEEDEEDEEAPEELKKLVPRSTDQAR